MCEVQKTTATPKPAYFMKQITSLFSSIASQLTPYSPIEPPDQIAKRLGIAEDDVIKLDANENPFGTSPKVLDALSRGKYLHIYPDPSQTKLREAIAAYVHMEAHNIVAGTGADEIIDLVCRLFLEPGDQVLTFAPTFGYYKHVVELNRGQLIQLPRKPDFTLDLNSVKPLNLNRVKVVFLCSPNNPTGNLVETEVLEWFLKQDLLVVVDEAYAEFSQHSFLDRVRSHPNLIILRTFSKCFALAGFRVGYGVMDPALAQGLMKIKPPYSVSVPAEHALIECLRDLPYYQEQVRQLIEIRQECQEQLNSFSQLHPFESQSNFILCQVTGYSALQLKQQLEKEGILVRYFDTDLLKGYIRISMGTKAQMQKFYQALHKQLG